MDRYGISARNRHLSLLNGYLGDLSDSPIIFSYDWNILELSE
ncbi:hypothetical protein LEP1GSC192_1332 [Leptospira sp. B5-022]|nr:hypothetical protein LEP1GSC192_1332 [Leptospira sp. B5-022]